MLSLAITSLFLLPIIVSLVCKQYKVTVFSAVCAVPIAITAVLNFMGYTFIDDIAYAIEFTSIILVAVAIILSLPIKKGILIAVCIILAIPVITVFSMGRNYSVEVNIDGTEYMASYCGFNVGPTSVGYHEKCNSVMYKYEPSFYSALICMGSPECIENCMIEYLEKGITDFYSSPNEAISALNNY